MDRALPKTQSNFTSKTSCRAQPTI